MAEIPKHNVHGEGDAMYEGQFDIRTGPPDRIWIDSDGKDQSFWNDNGDATGTTEYVRADLCPRASVAPQGDAQDWFAIAEVRPDPKEDVMLYRPSDQYCKFWVGRISDNPAVEYAWLTGKGEMPLGEFTHWARLREPSSPVSPSLKVEEAPDGLRALLESYAEPCAGDCEHSQCPLLRELHALQIKATLEKARLTVKPIVDRERAGEFVGDVMDMRLRAPSPSPSPVSPEHWLTCAKCGKSREGVNAGTFLCRYCFSTESVPAATPTPVVEQERYCRRCTHDLTLPRQANGWCAVVVRDAGGSLVYCGCKCEFASPSDSARKAAFREAIAVIVGLPTEHYIYSGPYRMEASTFRDNAVKALEAALVVGASKVPAPVVVEEGDEIVYVYEAFDNTMQCRRCKEVFKPDRNNRFSVLHSCKPSADAGLKRETTCNEE